MAESTMQKKTNSRLLELDRLVPTKPKEKKGFMTPVQDGKVSEEKIEQTCLSLKLGSR